MEVPMLLARFAALTYLCCGLGGLLNKKYFQKVVDDLNTNVGLAYIGGAIAIGVGFLMVNAYNVWAWNWTILVTIIGWVALLKGALHLIFPEQMMKISKKFLNGKSLGTISVLCIVIGLIFAYFGFVIVA